MSDADIINLALAVARVWLGAVIFAHGWRHLASVRSGPGIANWFDSLGLRPGFVHGWFVTITELAIGVLLIAGLATPAGYGGLCALMIVALFTNHLNNGFFINNPGEGWEYVGTTAVLSLALGALGPGEWSFDDVLGLEFPFDPTDAALITAVLGIGGALVFLIAFWRPGKNDGKSA